MAPAAREPHDEVAHERLLLERHRGGARGPEAAHQRPRVRRRAHVRGVVDRHVEVLPTGAGPERQRRQRVREGVVHAVAQGHGVLEEGRPVLGLEERVGLGPSAEEGRRAEAPERVADAGVGVALERVRRRALVLHPFGAEHLGRARRPPPRHAEARARPVLLGPARGAVLDRRVGGDAARARRIPRRVLTGARR